MAKTVPQPGQEQARNSSPGTIAVTRQDGPGCAETAATACLRRWTACRLDHGASARGSGVSPPGPHFSHAGRPSLPDLSAARARGRPGARAATCGKLGKPRAVYRVCPQALLLLQGLSLPANPSKSSVSWPPFTPPGSGPEAARRPPASRPQAAREPPASRPRRERPSPAGRGRIARVPS
jgi:hypothetical protein